MVRQLVSSSLVTITIYYIRKKCIIFIKKNGKMYNNIIEYKLWDVENRNPYTNCNA